MALPIQNSSTGLEWLEIDTLRIDVHIEHITPFERKFTKEFIYQNPSSYDIVDILIPLPEFLHGLKIIDEDNALLTFYSIQEIQNQIKKYPKNIKDVIEKKLTQAYLLWIRLPDHKSIKSKEVRTIRLEYLDANDYDKEKFSIFDTPIFDETIWKLDNLETYYFIKTSDDYIIEVDKIKSNAYTMEEFEADKQPHKIEINYLKERKQDDFKDTCIDIKNTSNYITARIPVSEKHYVLRLYYRIKLDSVERNIWKCVLPTVGFFLLIILTTTIYKNTNFSLNQTSLIAIGAAVTTVSGALIALISNPLIRRTRGLLFIHIILSVIILIMGGISKCTQTC